MSEEEPTCLCKNGENEASREQRAPFGRISIKHGRNFLKTNENLRRRKEMYSCGVPENWSLENKLGCRTLRRLWNRMHFLTSWL